MIAVYEHAHADEVDNALVNAVVKTAAQIEKASAMELKAVLDEAQAGLEG